MRAYVLCKYTFSDDFSVAYPVCCICCADAARISDIQRRSIPNGSKAVVVDDMRKNGSPTVVKTRQVEQGFSLGTDLSPAPKYTTSEKWIMEQQKRKLVIEQNWALKQKKTEQRIAACSEKLKVGCGNNLFTWLCCFCCCYKW